MTDQNQKINYQISQIKQTVHLLPGVCIIHRMPDFEIEYMSPSGLTQLGTSFEEVRSLTVQQYHNKYFNEEDAKNYIPKVKHMIESNTDECITFFQQVRLTGTDGWTWHMSTMRILMRDNTNLPLLIITMSYRIDPIQHVTGKVSRILEENDFLRNNYPRFSKLTKRECDVLRLEALGYSSLQMADQLFISVETVKTHRKNIRKKLSTSSIYQLSYYARAFDLICWFVSLLVTCFGDNLSWDIC
ncbi:response regulator transcription factor [Mucilaginibacter sp. AW1-3]